LVVGFARYQTAGDAKKVAKAALLEAAEAASPH
jgi:hypothetical protein